MKFFKDTNINIWVLDLGKFQLIFYKWGFGIDRHEYINEVKKWGYKNIFRL